MSKNKPRGAQSPPAGSAPAQTQGARFYNGPTVKSNKQSLSRAARNTSAAAKVTTKRAVATAQRHPWGFFSLISTIPFLIVLSLASTVLCPPPGPQSSVNKYILGPLGYPEHQSHPVLCYPANVYQHEVLQPYVYPILDDLHAKMTSSSPYVNYVEPTSRQVQQVGAKAWNGPVKPVVTRINRGINRFYLTFIQPHIPYYKAKVYAATAPYTARISALTAPHFAKLQAYNAQVTKGAVDYYTYAANHPYTGHASRYASKGYKVSSEKGYEAYKFSKPHAIRAGNEARRIATQILGPKAVKASEAAIAQLKEAWRALKSHASSRYHAHLEPHIGPYINRVSVALAPYYALYHKHIHTPYVQPAYHSAFPPQEKPTSFMGMLADWLPSSGQTAAESKNAMDDFFGDGEKGKQAARNAQLQKEAPVQAAKVDEPKKSSEKAQEKPFDRKDMDKALKDFKAKVDQQGKAGEKQVKQEMDRLYAEALNRHAGEFATNTRSELDREMEYVLKGLDKLYTQSPHLTQEQVKDSSDKADLRLRKVTDKIQERLEKKEKLVHEQGQPIVQKAYAALDQLLGQEYQDLATKMSWVDDVTVKDWDKYHALRKLASDYKDKYIAIRKDPVIFKHFSALRTELDDIHEAFRHRIGILRKTASDRISAREAVEGMKKEEKAKKPESGKVSALPIVAERGAEAAAGIIGAGGVIGKGKEQVMSALSAAGETAGPTGVVAQAKASADSIISAASVQVHEATRSAIIAAGGTPSPESPKEHAESVYNAASLAAASVLAAASTSLHEATRAAVKAAGATPSPESPSEHLESVYAAAAEGLAGIAVAAGDVVHHATKSVAEVVGGTPSAGGVAASLESIASAAGSAVHDATRSAVRAAGATPSPESFGESAESVYAAASSAALDASRAAVVAVGGTPSPESPAEHVHSAYHAATESASSMVSEFSDSASSVASDASASIHSATRSALSAAGSTPSPESAEEHLESIADAVKQGAASVYSAAGANAHTATRSLVRAAGGTPSPESPREHAESVYSAAAEGLAVASDAVAEHAAQLATQIHEALGGISSPSPLASSASSYLASLTSLGSANAAEAISTGSSLLSSIHAEASASLHSATSLLGATPAPTPTPVQGQGAEEVVDHVKAKAVSAKDMAASLVAKHAEQIKRDLDKDGKGVRDYAHAHAHAHAGENGRVRVKAEKVERGHEHVRGVKDEL